MCIRDRFNTFFLAPSFVKDSEVSGSIGGVVRPYFAEGQTIFGNLSQDGGNTPNASVDIFPFPGDIDGKCKGDLPRLMHEARIISRCWDSDDTLPIPVQWSNRVSIGTDHDVEGQGLQYRIKPFVAAHAGQPGSVCSNDGGCENGRCVHNICRT